MAVDIPEVAEVRNLLRELDEEGLISRLESFLLLNEGLESKRGEDFIKVSILGFLEGLLTSLKMKYPEDNEVRNLLERVSAKRREVDELFREPKLRNLSGE